MSTSTQMEPFTEALKVRRETAQSACNNVEPHKWYPPLKVIGLVRELMDEIDLDPASCEQAQSVINARDYFAVGFGLSQPWRGRVFLHPPPQFPTVQHHTEKLIGEYEAGRTTEAVVLVNNCTDAAWFQALARRFPLMFTRGRIAMWRPGCNRASTPRQGQALFYLSRHRRRPVETFDDDGIAYAPNIFTLRENHARFVNVFAQIANAPNLSMTPVREMK
jgi:hypothetical protein